MSLQNQSNFWKGLQERKSYIWSALDGGSIFTKRYNSEKYEKDTKRYPKTDQEGVRKITLVTLFAGELVVWQRQLAQMCALVGPRCKKGAQRASQRLKIQSKT